VKAFITLLRSHFPSRARTHTHTHTHKHTHTRARARAHIHTPLTSVQRTYACATISHRSQRKRPSPPGRRRDVEDLEDAFSIYRLIKKIGRELWSRTYFHHHLKTATSFFYKHTRLMRLVRIGSHPSLSLTLANLPNTRDPMYLSSLFSIYTRQHVKHTRLHASLFTLFY
jgi:hypothetical protein